MSRPKLPQLATFAIGVAALACAAATLGLIAGYGHDARRIGAIDARRAALAPVTAEEAAASRELLVIENDRTLATLEGQHRQRLLAWILVAAAAALIASCEWRRSLRPAHVVLPPKAYALTVSAKAVSQAPATSGAASVMAASVAAALAAPAISTSELAAVDTIVAQHGHERSAALPILQALQTHYGYLPEPALRRVCASTTITPAQLAGVASFFPQFRHTPGGRHTVRVCHGTACHVAGSARITDELEHNLGILPGHDTDPARRVTLEKVACLGCCTLAPVMQIDGHTHGHLLGHEALDLVARLNGPPAKTRHAARPHRRAFTRSAAHGEIRIGLGSCCVANGSALVRGALDVALSTLDMEVTVKPVGCVGICHQTPLLEFHDGRGGVARYGRVRPEHVAKLVQRHYPRPWARRAWEQVQRFADTVRRPAALAGAFTGGAGVSPAAAPGGAGVPPAAAPGGAGVPPAATPGGVGVPPADGCCSLDTAEGAATFLDRQVRIATEHCGELDPSDLDEYLRYDGFVALRRTVAALAPDELIDLVRQAGLRGRGGAGFPTADKWAIVRRAPGPLKYIIANGDEGDPGAFMDRMLMESYPYRVLEGLALAAWASGATEAWIYVRREYPLAVERLRRAVAACVQRGLLGNDALGPGRPLRVQVFEGAGAFVCGEETALIASIEGSRGTPRFRPPYPAESGLFGRPTLVNNVETLAVLPWIVRHGPTAFAALGTPGSRGTKVFALAGKIRRGGLIEVPMGITLRTIIEDIGGGVAPGHTFKAVQIGGPSGGCIPARLADTPIDYEALTRLGAMMGSGGLVVLDDTDCVVDVARYFMHFLQDQSCGRCVPCRVGTQRLLELLDRLCEGHGTPGLLDELEHLAQMVGRASLCGLGRTAPNPVLTTLHYFRDEYLAHVAGRCPAKRCKALIRYEITPKCTGCTLCAQHCPADAIPATPYLRHVIDTDKCTRCDICRVTCPEDAIEVL